MDIPAASDAFIRLTVGDGLVTQIPALIVSLAAGLLVSKGGNRGTVESAITRQLSRYPRALAVSGGILLALSLLPGLPFLPFFFLSALMFGAMSMANATRQREADKATAAKDLAEKEKQNATKNSAKNELRFAEVELCLGKQISSMVTLSQGELAGRVAKMRRKFAQQYGVIVPEIKLSDDLQIAPKEYAIKIHGTTAARFELRPGEVLAVLGGKEAPTLPGDAVREPAFGLDAMWFPEMFGAELKAKGFNAFDSLSVMLTHLSEVVRNNLSQLLSYRDLRMLTESLEPEYRKLLDEIVPGVLSFSSLQGILKLLLGERVSIRNLNLILESVAEIAVHARKPELIAEHVRNRLAQQMCGDLSEGGVLRVLRLGSKWDGAFLQALKRDPRGEIIEFDMDPEKLERFATDAARHVKPLLEQGRAFVLTTAPEARPYVRMIIDRIFPNLPVLSHLEVSRAAQIEVTGAMS
jgi:flagellar biosynthesis protein FlhA